MKQIAVGKTLAGRLRQFRVAWSVLFLLSAFTASATAQKSVSQQDALAILQRCVQCHGERLQASGLDLHTRAGMLKGGASGPAVVPGNAAASLLMQRVTGKIQPVMPMAPATSLSAADIATLKDWIDQGAKWDATDTRITSSNKPVSDVPSTYGDYKERQFTDEDRNWWAYQKPVRFPAPKVNDTRFALNPIDAFVRDRMNQKGLVPAPQADKQTLIRRAYLDLWGLLPPPKEVDAFVKNQDPAAYEKLVDRLLASPHYGERWGRFWLDVARYADSSGFEFDITVENGWRYRDYVIKAFNEDKPYNQLIVEQLAGDEIDKPTFDSLTATTFYRTGPRVRFREKNYPSYRYDYMDDMVRTTFQGFMGLSVNCAHCHDHKFDAITRLDYFKAVSAFWGYVDYDHPLAPKEKIQEFERLKKEAETKLTPLQQEIARIEKPYREKQRQQQVQDALKKYPDDIREAINTPEAGRTPGQKLLVAQVLIAPEDSDPDQIAADLGSISKKKTQAKANLVFGVADAYKPNGLKLSPADAARRQQLQAKIDKIIEALPEPLPVADGVRDGDYRLSPDGLGDSHIPGTGRPTYDVKCCFLPQPGQKFEIPPVYFAATGEDIIGDEKTFQVQPGFLSILADKVSVPPTVPPNRPDYVSSGRRRALAESIASADNPLTARVMVNRIWGWHFGRGIVSTPGNFGKMGTLPSNPELLDWLATEFVRQGWSIKQMQRLMMNSETYKMGSAFYDTSDLEKDPIDEFLWRFPIRRVEAEILRDTVLDASGNLNLTAGGPAFFPSIPITVRADQPRGTWDLTKEGPDTWRRSVYAYIKRGLKYPMFEVFDLPDLNVTCERRVTSTVPTQALTMLNNEFMLLQAGHFAARVIKEAGPDRREQVKTMYRIALSREPGALELDNNLEFLKKQTEQAKKRGDARAELAALTDLADVTLNLNEFVYIQ